ncbi:phosphatidylinositol 4-phosphate 5-kinase-like protein 1 isoform X2 [Acanthaster planci]|uniref:Phosphatidylinositol 4-phosphate 5-kinase-like protein 1 isoform X2 n=1 Tax=Acanthaster planci TaxID=133434 RepID=A0A8B7Z8D3_ACAPL|nr:phosphatidylinositol 4-phosphate 5-kinase-like protein 1 isoform X2 [Acanthaster planci]
MMAKGSETVQEEASFASLVRKAQKHWSHRGIIEIDKQHRLYKISRCIQMGIRGCISPHPSVEVENITHQEEDYLEVITQIHFEQDVNKQFEFRCYAPKVFASLRALVGVTEAEYLESLAPSGPPLPCLEFITSSKSGMTFFLCHNKAFIMKTEKSQDIAFLRSQFLHRLSRHFHDFPHSLLVKIVGCYFIKMSGSKGLFFTVMQSVFHPDERISERFDLKGCSASRYVQPLEEGSKEVIVLKDNNFDGRKINLGVQAPWFRRQVDIDTKFLEEQGIMDYSLLLGIQKLHADEKKTADKLADVVSRARRSIRAVSDSPSRVCPNCGGRFPTWNRRSNIKTQRPAAPPAEISSPHETYQNGDNTERMVREILEINLSSDSQQYTSHSGKCAADGEDWRENFYSRSQLSDNIYEQAHQDKEEVETGADKTQRNALPGMIEDDGSQPKPISSAKEEGTDKSKPTGKTNQTHSGNMRAAMLSPQQQNLSTTYCQCTGRFQIDKCTERNQRLLPDTINPLHIIDGVDDRYYVGIIDVLTQYGIRKKMEYLYKCLRYPTETFSTVKPEHYAQRFRELCCAKTE